MKKQIVSIGQCNADDFALKEMLKNNFDGQVHNVQSLDEFKSIAANQPVDLVLVNRILDASGDSGLELIETAKRDQELAGIPMMLVSNYADAQQQAIENGALQGFGKNALHAEQTREILEQALRIKTA